MLSCSLVELLSCNSYSVVNLFSCSVIELLSCLVARLLIIFLTGALECHGRLGLPGWSGTNSWPKFFKVSKNDISFCNSIICGLIIAKVLSQHSKIIFKCKPIHY